MTYTATITWDYRSGDSNRRNAIYAAMNTLGWDYVPTSSMVYDGDSVDPIAQALQVLAHDLDRPGELTMLALQVKLIEEPRPVPGNPPGDKHLDRVKNLGSRLK